MADANINTVWNLVNDLASKKGITEIVINGTKNVFVERDGQFIQLNVTLTKSHIYDFVKEIATFNRKECHRDIPILDGNLPDGSRINIIVEPFSKGSPAITIRKYLRSVPRSGFLRISQSCETIRQRGL